MGVPDTSKWKRPPGNFDTVNARLLFPSDNAFGIPSVYGTPEHEPEGLIAWTERKKCEDPDESAWQFYLDDYRFEPVWNNPGRHLDHIERAGGVLTPDFSCYLEWPRAMQIWNVYRSRWLGAYWESHGLNVIPTITWGDWKTYDFAFAGIGHDATVSVSTVGVRTEGSKQGFIDGYRAMIDEVQPSLVLVYGELWDELKLTDLAPTARYSPKGILEMRARLQRAVDRRQMNIFELMEHGEDDPDVLYNGAP